LPIKSPGVWHRSTSGRSKRGEKSQEQGARKLTGDLELFGLPDLLMQLERTQAQGVLTLSDKSGATAEYWIMKGAESRVAAAAGSRGRRPSISCSRSHFGTFVFQSMPPESKTRKRLMRQGFRKPRNSFLRELGDMTNSSGFGPLCLMAR